MKCEALLAYLSDYIDQNLSENLTQAAQDHLATCSNCRVVLDTTMQTIFLYKKQGMQAIPAQRRQRLFKQLESVFLNRSKPETPQP